MAKQRITAWTLGVLAVLSACQGHTPAPPNPTPDPQPTVRVLGRSGETPAPRPLQPEAPTPDSPTAPEPPRHLIAPPGALDRFLAAHESDVPLVVAQYGDSHSMDGSLANALRTHFSEGAPLSPAYVTPSHSPRWNANIKRGGDWNRQNWLRRADSGSFGPMGLAWVTQDPEATWTLKLEDGPSPPDTIATVFYAKQRGHLPLVVSAGGERLAKVPSAKAPRTGLELGRVEVTLPPGTTELTLSIGCTRCPADASVRVFGIQVKHPDARVEWDNFGIIGTSVRSLQNRTDHTLDDYLAQRDPDLLLIWYGANSVAPNGTNFDLARYRTKYEALIRTLRAGAPEASCLVLGPPDMAYYPEKTCFMNRAERRIVRKRSRSRADRKRLNGNRRARACDPDSLIRRRRGKIVEYPGERVNTPKQWRAYVEKCQPYSPDILPGLIALQKEVAAEHGCAYFDTYAAMGGPDTIKGWTCEDPPRAGSDLIHMTRRGYDALAAHLIDDLSSLSK